MGTQQTTPAGPDLTQGIADAELADGLLVGHVGDEAVLLARSGAEIFAVAPTCTHYGGPLADGLLAAETVRCPWHHACFSLRTGEALHAPAFAPLSSWEVEQRDGKIFVVRKRTAPASDPARHRAPASDQAERIIIIGGGAAGFAAAEMLRRETFGGSIVMLSSDDAPPVDRPNLSKDFLAGNAPEDWVPMRPDSYYAETAIDLRLSAPVTGIDVSGHEVTLASGERLAYDRLLLAPGAEPVRLSVPGADQSNVLVLRSLADCRAIIAHAKTARRAVVLGASFIGLEVAASLRARNIEVHVVAPDQRPMERILGAEMGEFVRSLHAEHGVVFHLEELVTSINGKDVKLRSGKTLTADFLVAGIGVRPRLELAQKAGLAIDRGVVVDQYLKTSAPDVFAAGDVARWPDGYSRHAIRVEHWVVAQRQGQVAARNMLGYREKFAAAPFFWSQHYDVPINYVGHAEKWDELVIDGDIAAKDCLVRYKAEGRLLAVASINRDIDSLKSELRMENAAAVPQI